MLLCATANDTRHGPNRAWVELARDVAAAVLADNDVTAEPADRVSVELLGNDRPGIVGAVSGVLAQHGLSVAELVSTTSDAPMAGGRLFEAIAVATVPAGTDLEAVQGDLERLATEIMVDIDLVDRS